MADLSMFYQALGGLLTGGATALTALGATMRKLKKRVTDLESKVGSGDDNPKTGLFASIEQVAKQVDTLRREITSWRDEPPEWLIMLVRRATRSVSSLGIDSFEIERFVTRVRQDIERLDNAVQTLDRQYIDRAEYDRDARTRIEELGKIREQLASVNGLLRGLRSFFKESATPQKVIEFDDYEEDASFLPDAHGPNKQR